MHNGDGSTPIRSGEFMRCTRPTSAGIPFHGLLWRKWSRDLQRCAVNICEMRRGKVSECDKTNRPIKVGQLQPLFSGRSREGIEINIAPLDNNPLFHSTPSLPYQSEGYNPIHRFYPILSRGAISEPIAGLIGCSKLEAFFHFCLLLTNHGQGNAGARTLL